MTRANHTLRELAALLAYEPRTGCFTWLVAHGRPAGTRAGYVNRCGYRYIQVDERVYREHRLAWLFSHGEWPPQNIDHINRDRSDNRLANLRLCNQSQNTHNAPSRGGRSRFKGVYLELKRGRYQWRARVMVDGRFHHVGWFTDEEAAARAYDAAAARLMGEYAHLNFPASRQKSGAETSQTARAPALALSGRSDFVTA